MGEICQIGVPPDPAFKTTFGAVDILLLIVLLMGVGLFTLWVSEANSNGRRWFGLRGAIIASMLLSLIVAFAIAMEWFFVFPSDSALKIWINHQSAFVSTQCSPEQLAAAYNPAYERLDWYHTFLFFIPAFVGGLGLLIVCLRAQPRPAS